VPWAILAGIGSIETDHGHSPTPGVRSGVNSYGCCSGPMQFNTRDGPPSTWDRYGVDGNHDGTKDTYDPEDAIASAANYLRALLRQADGNLSQAILGYNHSQAYVNDVLSRARHYSGQTDDELAAPISDVTATGCSGGGLDVPVGAANLRHAERLTAPRAYRTLPAWAMGGGRAPQLVDARIHSNVIWILRRYHLRLTAARESGHHTHGDGTAIDLIPADGTTQPVWDASAGRLAHDLGWTPACARSGSRPTCPLAAAIQFIGYDGYPSHGSPRTCAGGCPAHLHVSWASPCYGTSSLAPPCEAVMAFPTPPLT
jgi:transglycosylase-like protein with SLT domain